MSNPFTGDFDAVVQISLRQLNGLLAALHQNDTESAEAPLKLLHSVRTRIGEARRRPPHVDDFRDWVVDFRGARDLLSTVPLRDHLLTGQPPGFAARLTSAFHDLDIVIDPAPPDVVRGVASLQLSTLRLSGLDGVTSEITVHADVRARYKPDDGTGQLPAPINGEMRAAFVVRKVVIGGRTRLTIRPSPQDQKIQFIPAPGSGLSTADVAAIAAQVRRLLREGMTAPPVDLPDGFPFSEFKVLGGGATTSVALPLQLSGTPPPPDLQSLTQPFIGPSGFGIAVSAEHVKSLIDVERIRETIKQHPVRIHVSALGFSATIEYDLHFTQGPLLTFKTGAIEITGRVAVETDTWWAPNGWVSFKQAVTLTLDAASGRIELVAVGGPSVDESLFIPHSTAVNAVRREMAEALASNEPAVRRVFADARTNLTQALQSLEPSASARYTRLDVLPEGILIRGEFTSAARLAPVVEVGETDRGAAFTAFTSWIPGGRIDRFIWSWNEHTSAAATPWSGLIASATETHRFVLEKPPGITALGQICLRLEGMHIHPDGRDEPAAAGMFCLLPAPVFEIEAPSWWEPLAVPVWKGNIPETMRIRDAIAAHISVQTDREQHELTHNSLVFFPEWKSDTPFQLLAELLKVLGREPSPLMVLVVLPPEWFDATRRELDARLSVLPSTVSGRLQVAEDIEGGWTRTFDVTTVPSLFLVDARHRVTWKSTGHGDADAMARSLRDHLVPSPAVQFRPLRVHVPAGCRAPDVRFRDDGGNEGSLHRLLGRRTLLTFWMPWSEPSVAELRRIQALADASGRESPLSVRAFYGGSPRKDFDDIRRRYGLTVPIVPDFEHRIARAFGVRCWPTTITIDARGHVEHVQLGMYHAAERPSPGDDHAS